jgi:hypothetical protein
MKTTGDGHLVVWMGSVRSRRTANAVKGLTLLTFMTTSEKLK